MASWLIGPAAAYEGSWYACTEANNHFNQNSGLYAVFDFASTGLSDVNFLLAMDRILIGLSALRNCQDHLAYA